jgi:hypothetical protein
MAVSFEKSGPCAKCGDPAEPYKRTKKIVSVVLHYCDRCAPKN